MSSHITKKLKSLFFKNSLKISPYRNEDLPSFLLHQLFHSGSYLPYTTSSLRFRGMVCILNDISINSRKNILEFGAGISTILIARLIKFNNLDCILTSVEQNGNWVKHIQEILDKEGILQHVNCIHAPLVANGNENTELGYDVKLVTSQISERKFDMVIIDGPTAEEVKVKKSRHSNIKLFIDNLSSNYSIFIDNSDRDEEYVIGK